MPSKSPKQARFMAWCSSGKGPSSCPPVEVAKEFHAADKAKKSPRDMARAMKAAKPS